MRNVRWGAIFARRWFARGERGVRVRVLVDAVGSLLLPDHFWDPLRKAGGEVRLFNPMTLKRVTIRNHRKLLVCDERVAFVGGFNIAPEYEGDGVNDGWCDVGLKIEGPLAAQLALSFDEMFARADFRHRHFIALAQIQRQKDRGAAAGTNSVQRAGPGPNPVQARLATGFGGREKRPNHHRLFSADVAAAARFDARGAARREGAIDSGRQIRRAAFHARRAEPVSAAVAGRNVEIYEYQPQILHAKLIIVDDVVYIGSSNLDTRSLRINYELMIRFETGELAEQARRNFADTLQHCRRVTAEEWRQSRTFWRKTETALGLFSVEPD